MPPRGCLPNPCPMGAVDSRVTRSVGVGRAATARVLPGLQKPPPSNDLAGLCGLGLSVVLLLFGFGLTLVLPPLPGSVRRRPSLRLPVHSHRGTKSVPPLFVHRQVAAALGFEKLKREREFERSKRSEEGERGYL